MDPSNLYVTMIEIKRRTSEPGGVNIGDRDGGSSSCATDFSSWADVYVMLAKHFSALSWKHQQSIFAVHTEQRDMLCKEVITLSNEGLKIWNDSLPQELIDQATRIWEVIY